MLRNPAVALLLVVGLAGCGGMSRDELAAEANKIRKTANDKSSTKQPETMEELQEFAKQNAAATDAEIEQLAELAPPDEVKAKYDELLASLREKRDLTEQLGKAAADQDPQRLQEIVAKADAGRTKYGKITSDLGFDDCAPT